MIFSCQFQNIYIQFLKIPDSFLKKIHVPQVFENSKNPGFILKIPFPSFQKFQKFQIHFLKIPLPKFPKIPKIPDSFFKNSRTKVSENSKNPKFILKILVPKFPKIPKIPNSFLKSSRTKVSKNSRFIFKKKNSHTQVSKNSKSSKQHFKILVFFVYLIFKFQSSENFLKFRKVRIYFF